MKKTLLFSGALLALTSSMALAGAVDFAWNDCIGNTGASGNKNFVNCATVASTTTNAAAGSFFLDNAIPDFDALEITIDLQAEAAALPTWWDFSPGGCHATPTSSLSMTFDFSVFGNVDAACNDPFGQPATGALANYSVAGNRARAIGVAAIDASAPQPVAAATDYYGVRLGLKQDKSSGATPCAGCATKVALVLNNIRALGNAQTSHEDCNHPATSQCITWQGAGSATCAATPAHNATWGSIKSLYR